MSSSASAGIAGSTGRMAGIDAARAIAVVSTVWLHTVVSPTLGPTAEWGRYAVPLFNLAAGWFLVSHVRRRPGEGLGGYAALRFRRLYVPFLVWCALYVLARQVKRSLVTGEPPVSLGPEILLDGTAQHMWYLPFLLIWSVVGLVGVGWAVGRRRREVGLGLFFIGLGLAIGAFPEPEWFQRLPLPAYFLERTWMRMPSLLWGLGAALLATPAIRAVRLPPAASVAGVAWTAGCVAAWVAYGHKGLLQNLAGIGLVLLGLGMGPGRTRDFLAWLGRYAYGIFLAHTLFVEVASTGAHVAGLASAAWLDIAICTFAVAASVATTALAQRRRSTSWLLPM